jgi:hypothetical protein
MTADLVVFSSVALPDLTAELNAAEQTLAQARELAARDITPDECSACEHVYAAAKKRAADLEKTKLSLTADARAGVAKVNEFFAGRVKAWNAAADACRDATTRHQQRLMQERAEAQQRALAAHAAGAPVTEVREALIVAAEQTVATVGTAYRNVTRATVQDPAAVYAYLAQHPEQGGDMAPISVTVLERLAKLGVKLPGVTYAEVPELSRTAGRKA